MRADNHYKQYYDAFCLLFATGLRISEFCGLTTRDLDFKNKDTDLYRLYNTNIHEKIAEQKKREMQNNVE